MLNEQALNERAQHFLKVLIERYIRDGQPVGSRTLAKDAGMELSPATIRNVMADLEDQGLITSPHTSAGRVPTVHGYRLFVDSLISLQPVDHRSIKRLQGELDEKEAPQNLVETSRRFTRDELEQASRFINDHYSGLELDAIKSRIVREMEEYQQNMDKLMREALSIADEALQDEGEDQDYIVSGQTNLMDFDELAQLDRIKMMFDAFSEKQEILHLLDRCSQAEGVQLFIGEESGYGPLEKCSVVTAPYEMDNTVVGVLGVIGPTRMAYDRVIPIVDITAKMLGAALKSA
ncbi:HrcA family transcriptional regulator [Thiolapillus sp.]|uniref:HrcA family transcriptional regulator n=2 Tax=Thiolapillus sp. TaxID=2017437 RepID=UPI003AF5EE39